MSQNGRNDWANTAIDELKRERLDQALDRELEATFPASDALKITLSKPNAFQKRIYRGQEDLTSTTLVDLLSPRLATNPFSAVRASLMRQSDDERDDGVAHSGKLG